MKQISALGLNNHGYARCLVSFCSDAGWLFASLEPARSDSQVGVGGNMAETQSHDLIVQTSDRFSGAFVSNAGASFEGAIVERDGSALERKVDQFAAPKAAVSVLVSVEHNRLTFEGLVFIKHLVAPVVGRTITVAGRGEAASLSPEGRR